MGKKVTLFLMTLKGYVVLHDLIINGFAPIISKVIIAHDHNMLNDYYEEMYLECKKANIHVIDNHTSFKVDSDYCIAIGWRWLIPLNDKVKIIVIHDSLLPKYRGFSPLVNMLINREPYIGVTALYACQEYDKGDIIAQKKVKVSYPIKIIDAINMLTPLYSDLVCELFRRVNCGSIIKGLPQKEENSSYSLWRGEEDYRIDWNMSSEDIFQFVNSVGYPYKGASTIFEGELLRVNECEVYKDVIIENRVPGKIIFMCGIYPVVVCGTGLLKLVNITKEDGSSAFPLKKFRVKLQ